MNFKKALTITFAGILVFNANNAISEGQADRENNKTFGPVTAELLIQHINNTFGATAAGNGMVGMKTIEEQDRLSFKYSGQKQNAQFTKLTAIEYRKASVGSNH